MPIVTNSRVKTPKMNFVHRCREDSTYRASGSIDGYPDQQFTTSYRSGGDLVDPDDLVVEAASKGSGLSARRSLNKAVRDEYKSRYDNGHEFETVKYYARTDPSVRLNPRNTGLTLEYVGPCYPQQYQLSQFPDLRVQNESEKIRDGVRAVNLSLPTNSAANLAQVLGEARQRLPSLIGFQTARRGLSTRNTGSEYLNVEFGIRPLIADVRGLADAYVKHERILEQLRRDSDKVVRRKRTLYKDNKVTGPFDVPASLPPAMGDMNDQPFYKELYFESWGPITYVDQIVTTCRFAGAFQYHLAGVDTFLSRLERNRQELAILTGAEITPDLVYQLTPWSWLVDWGSNLGDVIANITAFNSDNLVMRYGYIMHERRAERTFTQPVVLRGGERRSLNITYGMIHKSRIKATPYGFGVDLQNLSPRRWAILGALGMTKSPRSLR